MSTSDSGIDLSPLDPEQDPSRLDRVVDAVMHRLGPGIVEEQPSLAARVAESYARRFAPLLAVAAVIALVAAIDLFSSRSSQLRPWPGTGMEIPVAWASWLASETTPTTEDLLLSLAREDR